MLKINDLSISFDGIHQVLDHFNLELEVGDFVTIIGSNGAGKSTLLNCIAGMYPQAKGTISLNEKNITSMKQHQRSKFIGHLMQDPTKGTAPHLTIEENLGLVYNKGRKHSPFALAVGKKERQYFKTLLEPLKLGLEERLNSPISTLSGGQRQALTLLMATMNTPQILLLDEHTAALDPKTSKAILELTNKITQQNPMITLMITHDLDTALSMGNKTILMNEGKIILSLDKEARKKMTSERLIQLYSNKISDRMIFK